MNEMNGQISFSTMLEYFNNPNIRLPDSSKKAIEEFNDSIQRLKGLHQDLQHFQKDKRITANNFNTFIHTIKEIVKYTGKSKEIYIQNKMLFDSLIEIIHL